MIRDILNSGTKLRLDLYGKYELPPWTITHFCHQTLINCLKMTTIVNILKLFDSGKTSEDFLIEVKPKDLYPDFDDELLKKTTRILNTREILDNENKVIHLFSKESSPSEFWRLLKRQDRPNVLVRDRGFWVPVYSQEYRTSIKLRSLSVSSPPTISFEGLGETINDLRFGKNQEIREHVNWQNEQINNATNNIHNIIRSSATLNDPNIPQGLKAYATEIYNSLIDKQIELNNKIGLDRSILREIEENV